MTIPLAFLWTMRSGQLEDLDGAAVRVLLDHEDRPLKEPSFDHDDSATTEREHDA